MKSSGEDTRKLADATARLSTNPRAYIFVTWPSQGIFPEPAVALSTQPRNFSVTVKFEIVNHGDTPAIITDIDAHLLIADNNYMSPTMVEPDPLSAEGMMLRESNSTWGNGGLFGDLKSVNAIIAPKSTSGELSKIFTFRQRIASVLIHNKWFYCKVKYLDIYQIERETSLYGGISGTILTMPQHTQYYYWK